MPYNQIGKVSNVKGQVTILGGLFSDMQALLVATLIGYVLGALPIAGYIAERHGVDRFAVGTGLTGASNVRRHVGNLPGGFVLLGDLGKGALAIIIAKLFGVSGLWLMVPAGASIIGHWRSVFTGFRGGDGMATLGGIIIAVFPVFGFAAVAVSMIISLGGQKMPYSSLLTVIFGYSTLMVLNLTYYGDMDMVMVMTKGIGILSAMVLGYATLGHFRRRRRDGWDELDEPEGSEGATEPTSLGQ